ncbi:MAG: ATP-binding protein [Phycisphaerae bacterium]|nr:ATP-binding protein [Phycisphaerae bacterium]
MDPLSIGHVIGVDGDEVRVQISRENLRLEYHGTTHRVGRLGTYVTLPMGRDLLVGYVTAIGTQGDLEPGPDPVAPRRIVMSVQLLGTIRDEKFVRGVNEYPTLGDTVRLGVDEDFELIFGSFDELARGEGYPRAFAMGRFAVDTDFEVKVLGKDFFSKHVAVMGNSGSGKSVTTAKIIHEALKLPHSQIIMFDMHGEYSHAFSDDDGNPLPNVTYLSDKNLVLPYWMLRYDEFEDLFVDTNDPLNINAQKIFLRSAFEKLKAPAAKELGLLHECTVDTPVFYDVENLKVFAENMNDARFVVNTDTYAFARLPQRSLPTEEQEALLMTRRMEFNQGNPEGEVPHATYHGRLLGFINQIETRLHDRRYDFLLKPFDQAEKNAELAGRLRRERTPGQLSKSVSWVIRQMLGRLDKRKNLTIVDLSGLPFDVVDITVAVLTRTLFDFNFWSPPDVRRPFVLCYEEAHNYLPREARGRRTYARDAVEKVAKEGRKYGVSAMIVSQRPSEISETILSQCNSMVLMRMNNPDDQDYAARVVSDQFRSLISILPSMKPGEGFIIGDAVMMPMRTLIDMPPKLPRSGDVDFFKLWSQPANGGDVERIVDRWWRQDRSLLADTEPQPGGFVEGSGEIESASASTDEAEAHKPSAKDKLAELAALLAHPNEA